MRKKYPKKRYVKKGRVTPTKTTTEFSGQGVTRPFINKRNRLILGQGDMRSFINKRNRLILGSGKKKKNKNKEVIFWDHF